MVRMLILASGLQIAAIVGFVAAFNLYKQFGAHF